MRMIKSSGNVFVGLGFDSAEARVMVMRVKRMLRLRERIEADGLTQRQAAKRLDTAHFGAVQRRMARLQHGYAANPGRARQDASSATGLSDGFRRQTE